MEHVEEILDRMLANGLNDKLVWDWLDDLGAAAAFDDVTLAGLGGDALEAGEGSSGAVGLAHFFVFVDSGDEAESRARVLYMLDADVDAFGEDLSADAFVDDNPDGVLRNVENATSLSVIALVRHTLLHGTISLDINDIPALVNVHIGRETDHTPLPELLGEHVTRSASLSMGVCHFGAG